MSFPALPDKLSFPLSPNNLLLPSREYMLSFPSPPCIIVSNEYKALILSSP